jgi:hypothetical protein
MHNDNTYQPASFLITRWLKIALFCFLIAASIGVLLRFAFVNEVKWLDYKAFQAAHSNLALLGWGFLGFFSLLLGIYGTGPVIEKRIYKGIFWSSFILIALSSIAFVMIKSKLIPNIIISAISINALIFAVTFWKDTHLQNKDRISYRFAIMALVFLCISFLGSYMAVIAILASGAKKILLYYLSTQFFLHFQYNGWFTFGLLGLLFRFCETKGVPLNEQKNRNIFYGLTAGVFITFFISLFWGDQNKLWLLFIAAIGGLFQAFPIVIYHKYIFSTVKDILGHLSKPLKVLITISLICFLLKLLLQLIIMIPFIATLAFTIRNYVIAYIHLVFIGMTSLFLFAWAVQHAYLTFSKTVQVGIYSLVIGFILVELVLFIQGTMFWMGKGFLSFYYPLLFLVSVLLPLGLLFITIRNLKYLPFKKQLQ